jgi:predicted nucleic acid-binding protein
VSTFFDTNIVVYAFLDDPRQSRARAALSDGGIISVQVLNEFTSVSRKKHRRPWGEIEAALATIRAQFSSILPLTIDTHASAVALARDHSLSFYDALIVASALEAGCDTLLTEDMQHARVIGALTIENPFA